MREQASCLTRYEPFAALPQEELERIASLVVERKVEPGRDVLVADGPPAQALYVIRSGSMELLHDGEVVDVLVRERRSGTLRSSRGSRPRSRSARTSRRSSTRSRRPSQSTCSPVPRERASSRPRCGSG
jgi:signal-transduction protein with cAMP-binding, CBS, and nucleotidyltransferase domain